MDSALQNLTELPQASMRFDCRPAWRWANCGPDYSNSIRIFYWVFFGIHLLSTLGALAFAVKTFCLCGKRRKERTYGRTSLRVFTSFCIAGFCGVCLYSYFLTDPKAFGVPTYIVSIGYAVAVESMACSASLVILTWAESLSDAQLVVRSSFLTHYRKYYWMVLAERFINGALFCIAAADISGSYLLVYRIYLAQWSLYTLFLGIAIIYFGLRMRWRLQKIGSPKAVARTTRIIVLYITADLVACVFTALQCIFQPATEEHPVLWFIFMGAYHTNIVLLSFWFIVGRPHHNELARTGLKKKAAATQTGIGQDSIIAYDGSSHTRRLSEVESRVLDSSSSASASTS
eukprot:TRINITY_DN14223_c0_g1_i1.p1 TRINITY_DN14223_c0_g1~~TRINITY_DN14223_c0_g1_i1.p1  ORF type:complete len:345 (+),score=12.86 TRINITY_DN14223_c0_g1_i1:174-1208(+)